MGQIPKGLVYIKSIPFFLNVGAFVILIIAIVTLGIFLDNADVSIPEYAGGATSSRKTFDFYGKKGRLDYGMFAIVISWLVTIVMVALFMTGLHEKVSFINWPMTVVINLVIWGLLLIIAGCLIADTARQYDKRRGGGIPSFCVHLKTDFANSSARCGHLVGAAVTCFIATILFGLNAFFNIQIFRGQSTPAGAPPAVPT